jgi:hypothetical protein
MSLTLIVEDGTVVTGANSYLTLDEANTIIALDLMTDSAPWTALADDAKSMWLMFATRWLDDRAIWRGHRFTDPLFPRDPHPPTPQPLGWPRKDAYDRERHAVSSTIVPAEVKRAVALLANHYLNSNGEDEAQAGLRRFRADTFEIEYQMGYFKSPTPPWLKFTLNGLGQLASEIGFKKIVRV